MALFGWIVCLILLCGVSLIWVIAAAVGLGAYNIGGVPNSWSKRISIVLFGGVIWYLFTALIHYAPFSVTMVV